ncbi:MAG TPA: PilN domain-containing protein [Terriglobia bacterium]|nr:PilN domain-containing protein [Terriglobia bacterium]
MLAVFVVLVAISAGQVYGYFHYTELANGIKDSERNLKAETEGLAKQEQQLRTQLGGTLATAKISEVTYINSMIERRNFCWTCLLRHIETRIPVNVHLTSLKPERGPDGKIVLSLSAQGRSLADLADFIDRLQSAEVFEKVNVAVEEKHQNDYSITMTVPYFPERDPGQLKERRGD